jgi:hypothetical protein
MFCGTFRNTLSVPSSQAVSAGTITGIRFYLNTPPTKMEQTVFRNVGTENEDAEKPPKIKNTTNT